MRKLVFVVVLVLAILPFGAARAQFCPGAAPYVFTDVPANDAFCGFVTRMAVDGITGGCQIIDANNRLYCPNDPVTRLQMAAFMMRLSDVLFPLNCAAGQIMKWNSTDWVCANDVGSGSPGSGTVTQLSQGNGILLAPNPITTVGTISADTNYLQRRVANACAAGSSIRVINADGTIVCDSDDVGTGGGLPSGQTNETLRHNGTTFVASSALTNDGTDIGITGSLNLPGNVRVMAGILPFISNLPARGSTFVGELAGNVASTGLSNTAFGSLAASTLTSGDNNTAVGASTGASITTGDDNSYFGRSAGRANQTGHRGSFFGSFAGRNTTTGDDNSFFGYFAGSDTTIGGGNAFFGALAGEKNITGSNNVYVGLNAGASGTGSAGNVFAGHRAGFSNTANANVFVGENAGASSTIGNFNTFLGHRAGEANTTGAGNVFIGDNASGTNTTSRGNVVINGGLGAPNLQNATAIGGAVVSQNNSVVLGSPTARVGIRTATPQEALDVVGNAIVQLNLTVGGTLSQRRGQLRIDHPVDPAGRMLSHSFVESPDMKNIYDGITVLDESGEAIVDLPEWFNALNRDFRYQLTCIGGFANVYIAEEVANNRFKIAGGRKGLKVSWQVTGIRQDAWANANRIPVEEDKAHACARLLPSPRGVRDAAQPWHRSRAKCRRDDAGQRSPACKRPALRAN